MALINCPECGKQISDKTQSCPNCGFPINASKVDKNQLTIDNEVDSEVKKLIASGSKLAAVKYYKEKMNCGLIEAKDKVDAMSGVISSNQRKNNFTKKTLTPEQLENRVKTNKKIWRFGCLPLLILFVIMIIAVNKCDDSIADGDNIKIVNMDSICSQIKLDDVYQVTDVYFNSKDSSLNIAIEYKKNDIVSAVYFDNAYGIDSIDKVEGIYLYKKGTSLANADKKQSLSYSSRNLANRIKEFEDSGFEYNIKSYLKKNLDDPRNLEILKKWVLSENADGTFAVKVTFRAMNPYGALMIHTMNCDMDMEGNGTNIEFDK